MVLRGPLPLPVRVIPRPCMAHMAVIGDPGSPKLNTAPERGQYVTLLEMQVGLFLHAESRFPLGCAKASGA